VSRWVSDQLNAIYPSKQRRTCPRIEFLKNSRILPSISNEAITQIVTRGPVASALSLISVMKRGRTSSNSKNSDTATGPSRGAKRTRAIQTVPQQEDTGPTTMKTTPHYWLGVAHRDHVLVGAAEGFVRLCHGRSNPLKKLDVGDYLVYYSPSAFSNKKTNLRSFTAFTRIEGASVESVPSREGAFRRSAKFLPCVEAPIKSIVGLELTKGAHWGMRLRSGLVALDEGDFKLIANAMKIDREELPKLN
jgi:hypothetical protein